MGKEYDILLCDLDAFFVSVELLDRPELRGKPVIVGGDPGGRGVVATCSYEARQYGVRSAMPVKRALELCPGVIVLPVNMPRYRELSGKVQELFKLYTPHIEFVSIDEAYLAVSKGAGYDTAKAIHAAVRQELNLPVSVGVSCNKLLAKVSCELAKPNSVRTLWPEEVADLFWPLPVKAIPGIGPVTEKQLHRYGIKTVRDLAQYPVNSLTHFLGIHAKTFHRYANGIDDREIKYDHEVKSISEETTFPEDVYDWGTAFAVVQGLSEGVGYRLRSGRITARTITLKLRFGDFRTITRSKTLTEAVDGDYHIYRVVKELFERHCGKPPWRLIGVKVSGFERGKQLSILTPPPREEKERSLLLARDRIREKYGAGVLIHARRLSKKRPT